jgi:hypothetical protein
MNPMTPLCPVCEEPMKEHGRAFQCEPCRQIIIFFAVSDASPYEYPHHGHGPLGIRPATAATSHGARVYPANRCHRRQEAHHAALSSGQSVMRSKSRRSACWTATAARAAVFASAAPADTTHKDQLLSVWPSVTRFIAMLTTFEQPGCFRISFSARHCKSSIESRDFAIRGFTSNR